MKINVTNINDWSWRSFVLVMFLLLLPPAVESHEGPPFPIIIDQEVGPYLVSVWTDPDIGIGTFFVVFDPRKSATQSMDINSVQIGVAPTSGRLSEKLYDAERQVTRSVRYNTEVEFDKGEMWKVRVVIKGTGWEGELHSEVEATPDGNIGPIAVLVYAIPFIGIGILWFRAIMVRRRKEDEE
ncbi:hypothetical protein [Fodinibius salsisoli]|uniref:YtkA-like n=1 Tax=Fodinibius salsisoli TaxID=2820877 RepID=A0ABT3PPQ4_9BACT|nr:hypothetical protein [Fodinibius salsisoli]MCW9707843.1 hypothetical protein [Fodinibius salsisoli]